MCEIWRERRLVQCENGLDILHTYDKMGMIGGYQVNETKVARNADERTADRIVYRNVRLVTPLKSKSVFIGK